MWNEGPLLFSLLWVFIWIIRAVLVRVYLFLLSTLAWDWLLLSRLDFGRYLFNESTGLDVYLPSKYKSHGSPQWPDIVMMQSDSQVIFDSGHATQGKCPTLSQSVSCKEMLSCFPSSDPTLLCGNDLWNKDKKEILVLNIFHYWQNFFYEQNIRTITKVSIFLIWEKIIGPCSGKIIFSTWVKVS